MSTNALAGGVGLLATSGMYSETVYFYDSSKEFQKFEQMQTIGTFGTGLEFTLGDRDDRVMGLARAYWLYETPQQDPADRTELVASDDVVAAWRENGRNVGMFSVGLQWGFYGDPSNFQLYALGMVGSGFLTTDHTEFLLVEAGVGASYRLTRSIDAHVEVQYALRNRKGLRHGVNGYAGVRYLFD